MRFQPKSEEEIQKANLAPAGEYDFQVVSAEDATSKKGNPMIKIKLGIFSGEAMAWQVTDYLIEAMAEKLRHFCDCVGLLKKYEAGTLDAIDCRGREGRVILEIEEQTGFHSKNSVVNYVCKEVKPAVTAGPAAAPRAPLGEPQPTDGDDIPF